MKWFKSPLLIPGLFFLFNYKLWMGIQTLAADTGDGIGAFKFFSIFPKYWNWYEAGGQPYWTEMAIYRLQDPLMWPLVFVSKALPMSPLIQFNVYILLRLCLLGVGLFYLLKNLKCGNFSTQLGTMIAMFGSAVPVMFRSIGALDVIETFVFLSLFSIQFYNTQKRIYIFLLIFTLLHASITYHILYLIPVGILASFILRKYLKEFIQRLLRFRLEVVFGILAIFSALGAEYTAIKDPFLLPALRSMRYGTWIDSNGKVVEKEIGVGESVLNEGNLKANAEDCGTRFSCRFYPPTLLKTFILKDSAWSLTGYVSVAGLFLLLLSFIFIRKLILFHSIAVLCFVLSLGSQIPVWGWVQKVIPVLQYVRHTGFYFHLFALILCILISLTVNNLEKKMSGSFKTLLFVIVLLDLLSFQRLYVSGFLNFIKEGQLEKIATPIVPNFTSRELRIYNPYLIPRSSVSTAYGIPSALESIFVQDEITPDHLKRGENPRYFGFITLFLSKPMAQLRVKLGDDLEKYKERVGVKPYSILSPVNERKKGVDLRIVGENLRAQFTSESFSSMYLSIPVEAVDTIELNGKPVSYSSSENGYGILFSSEKGINELKIVPKLGRRNLIYSLYYGAYVFVFILLLEPLKFFSRIFRDTSFNLSDLLSRRRVSNISRT